MPCPSLRGQSVTIAYICQKAYELAAMGGGLAETVGAVVEVKASWSVRSASNSWKLDTVLNHRN